MIYLDWAATALPQEVIITEALKKSFEYFANPSAKHFMGKEARKILEEARAELAEILNISSQHIIFTSGGTEGDNIPMLSLLSLPSACSIAVSNIEHSAVREQAHVMKARGYKILQIPADKNGFISADAVLKTIDSETAFVSVMAVNNETGAIQPISEIGKALEEYSKGKRKIHFHTDAVQAIGKIPFELSKLPVHSASFSGHKIGAPRGIGFLYLAKNIEAFIRGGGQEGGIRPGTENLAGILALSGCLKKYHENLGDYLFHAKELMDFLIEELAGIEGLSFIPEVRPQQKDKFSLWILQFAVKELTGEVLVRCLSEKGICISTGSACSSKKQTRPVLEAMKVEPKMQLNSVRVSIGPATQKEELEIFVKSLKEILNEFR
ncbi:MULTISPECIES: cysteine desulfurase family protein [unclassified Treponema]|uniref:cysteine desulfurase family protein n=1 Tax=unclassified Treponema TaxID=2638727 RepID=UPI0020A61BF4|nr:MULTISPECIES: cysteine desulfurase family protein [unclassified Treponema]UTC66632.1 cysteine desulfurase [Treponema sp. OMZ 789]UTC69364.1 cysteine desulfurase [Treponema sp. OMZ 790]UTC72079.1 cysteine desulfurase [Treponema sp. OMZ 791]